MIKVTNYTNRSVPDGAAVVLFFVIWYLSLLMDRAPPAAAGDDASVCVRHVGLKPQLACLLEGFNILCVFPCICVPLHGAGCAITLAVSA